MTFRVITTGLMVLGSIMISGCTTGATSNTARTAKEQLLISNAVDQSLAKVDFASIGGTKVFLEEKYLDSVDKPYIVGSLRAHILRSGGTLTAKAEDADIIMEARSGGVGTDMTEKFVGIQEIALPGVLTIPEIRFAENKTQEAYAKIGLVAIDAKSGTLLGSGGVASARSNDNNWFVMGVGPFQNGTLQNEVNLAVQRPMGMNRRSITRNVAFSRPASGSPEGSPYQLASERTEVEEK